ncbi:DUF4097 family beta strand repeat-containing protein [Spirillospora sp. NPDC048911]|uniref:DUF4097 family beta strand repeat-containing protein n=1 Tax=Spirillospora sp. NPDC048911 TaxID=3364527 RepID=UPI00371827DA
MTTRTLIAERPGPVLVVIDLPAGAITVTAEPERRTAEMTITARGDDPAVADAVRRAVLRWNTNYGRGGGALLAAVPEVRGGGVQTTVRNHGGTVITQITGSIPAGASVTGAVIGADGAITIGGGKVVIDGVTVVGGDIEITARVPEGSHLAVRTRSADLAAHGEYASVDFVSVSGGLALGGTVRLTAETTSGDVRAAAVDGPAEVRSVSGDIRIDRADDVQARTTSGAIALPDTGGLIATATVSGDITVHATEGGTVGARSVSGDVTVTAAPAALAEGLTVRADSRSGTVTTPDDTPTAAARPRRPRRGTGGA